MRLWIPFLFLSQNTSSSLSDPMSPKVGPAGQSASTHLWMLLRPLLCALILAKGSTLSTEDLQSTTTMSLLEDWTGTTIQLQPDLQTEAGTPTDTQTEATTLTETQTQSTTSNYTGQYVYQTSIVFNLFLLLKHSCVCKVQWLILLVSKMFWTACRKLNPRCKKYFVQLESLQSLN